jgi:tetraacyldisaccharide 4'-kinase
LRAPFAAQMAQAQALIIMGRGEAGDDLSTQAQSNPVIRAELVLDQAVLGSLKEEKLIAFCGIGRPEKFAQTLRAGGVGAVELAPFPDHHAYQDSDAERLLTLAQMQGARLVTTEKDAVKLKGSAALERLRDAAIILPVQAKITEGETAFRALIGL